MGGQEESLFDGHVAFGVGFMEDHAGHIITDQQVALVELIANAYDAGATRVDVTWPAEIGDVFRITDNGIGMTLAEFNRRWRTLSYRRLLEQGEEVVFPAGTKGRARMAFGQNGKGRHGAFCFSNRYEIETWRDGTCIKATVSLTDTDGGAEPFHCQVTGETKHQGHGTGISVTIAKQPLPLGMIQEAVGSKFLVDPSFSITLNKQKLQLLDLRDIQSVEIPVEQGLTVRIHYIDGSLHDRTTQLHGITWWVRNRMVGHSSWEDLDGNGAILDGRTALAKRTSFVVEADWLKPDVHDDWSGFRDTPRTLTVRRCVRNYVIEKLDAVLSGSRKQKKAAALNETRLALKNLPNLSRRMVARFVDEVQDTCPNLSQGDLVRTVQIYTKLEEARSGYELLERLAKCTPNDLDTWNKLMVEWTASNAEIVLGELKRRLDLVAQLQGLIHVATTDELHELQPLFARGLWMFGPEYEAVDFMSNRTMATVIRQKLGGGESAVPNCRPDFVALPDRSIGVYCADEFDSSGEVAGFRKVMVVELKKGGAEIGIGELRQGEDYAVELRNANHVKADCEIVVFVLGATIAPGATEERVIGRTVVKPMMYDVILKKAQARTFNLQRKLEAAKPMSEEDPVIQEVLASAEPLLGTAASK